MKLYQRYLFWQMAKTFILFFVCIFLIFTLVDLSMRGVRFFSHGVIGIFDILTYYIYSFANYLSFFFPLTFLLSLLRVVLDLNSHNELVALQMAGLSQKKLLKPLFFFAAILTCLSYANQEFLAPKSQEFAKTFRSKYAKRQKKTAKTNLFSIPLQTGELVYQEANEKELFDVFWIKGNKELWHMKFLNFGQDQVPQGSYVDRFQRNSDGKFEKIASFETRAFPQIVFDEELSLHSLIPPENLPLSLLFKQKNAFCYLHQKLSMPMLCFLILILLSPSIISFSRSKPAFLITAISLFCFVGFMTILEGMFILAENQVLSNILALWGPLFAACLVGLPRFVKV